MTTPHTLETRNLSTQHADGPDFLQKAGAGATALGLLSLAAPTAFAADAQHTLDMSSGTGNFFIKHLSQADVA
jgi:hypothetical protein